MISDRTDQITKRLVFSLFTGEEADYLFSSVFQVVRQKAREFKTEKEEEACAYLESDLIKDLKDRGLNVVSVEISLGKYRGSRFVTSAKVKVLSNNIGQANSLVKVLQRYHPRYNLKSYDEKTKTAEYNIR